MEKINTKVLVAGFAFGGTGFLIGMGANATGKALASRKLLHPTTPSTPPDDSSLSVTTQADKDEAYLLEISNTVAAGVYYLTAILFFIIILASLRK